MLPDRVSNPGPPIYEPGALPIALHGPARYYVFYGISHGHYSTASVDPSYNDSNRCQRFCCQTE